MPSTDVLETGFPGDGVWERDFVGSGPDEMGMTNGTMTYCRPACFY